MRHEEYAKGEPSITREENDALFRRLGAGEDVRGEIVERNFPLADGKARKWYRDGGPDIEELQAAARGGLAKAVDRFDAARGLSFSTYADHWIRRELGTCLRDHKIISPPKGGAKNSTRKGDAKRFESTPSAFTNFASVRGPGVDAFDDIPDDREENPINPDTAGALLDALRPRFSPFELMLIDARFGIGSAAPRATYNMARRLGINPKAVNTIIDDAIARVRSELNGASPEDVIDGL